MGRPKGSKNKVKKTSKIKIKPKTTRAVTRKRIAVPVAAAAVTDTKPIVRALSEFAEARRTIVAGIQTILNISKASYLDGWAQYLARCAELRVKPNVDAFMANHANALAALGMCHLDFTVDIEVDDQPVPSFEEPKVEQEQEAVEQEVAVVEQEQEVAVVEQEEKEAADAAISAIGNLL